MARIHTYQAFDAIKIETGNQTVQEITDEICVPVIEAPICQAELASES